MHKPVLTHARLIELLDYNAETGVFVWKVSHGSVRSETITGYLNEAGYLVIGIDGRVYKAHRLAWFYVNGTWPKNSLDHINHDKTNNSIANLRDVTKHCNLQNQIKAHAINKSGFLGVYFHRGRYEASITIAGKQKYIGRFNTPEEAYEAYLAAKRIYHEGCTI